MALCERQLGNIPAALHYFSVAMEKDTAEAGLYGCLHLGVTKLLGKDYRGAIAALEHENRIFDKFAETWYYLALAHETLGQKPLAHEYLLHAKNLLEDTSGIYHLHEVYCEMFDTVYPADVETALAGLQ